MKISIPKLICIIITVLFFVIMFMLTIFARQLHDATLPKVTVERLDNALFPNDVGGSESQLVISAEMYHSGKVYVLYTGVKNGEERQLVRLVQVEIGREGDGVYEVLSGVDSRDYVVVAHEGELAHGAEVVIIR